MMIAGCKDIRKYFAIERGLLKRGLGFVKAVDGVSLEVEKGRTHGLVGESGCGKTTLGKIILGIMKPDSGEVSLLTEKIQVIFQDPFNSLDPKMRVLDILSEGLILKNECHGLKSRVEEALYLVKLPKNALVKYPHQFSGGERQRIAIARAVLTQPEFIVCDEPVSNLDVTIQLAILNLLKNIQKKFGITYLFVSHDLRVIKFMSDSVSVMKEGRIIEGGPADKIYSTPSQQYTKELISSVLDMYSGL